MRTVHIFGAGSIGNHLSYAARQKDWEVSVIDTDTLALARMKEEIYPERYGRWDDSIRLYLRTDYCPKTCDIVIIGTPPDTHIELACWAIPHLKPKILLIEKPLCPPDLAGAQELLKISGVYGTRVLVGYNHTLTTNTIKAESLLAFDPGIGVPHRLSAYFLEHWQGIFQAHPWLEGPRGSYLGFFRRGGGASGEHSHAINIWQHFAHCLGQGRISEVVAQIDYVKNDGVYYDQKCQLQVKTERGLEGEIIQDVITHPAQKYVCIEGSKGILKWHVNKDANHDAVGMGLNGQEISEEFISKTRPDDFIGEINHMDQLLNNPQKTSPIDLKRGLETMLVIAAAHASAQKSRPMWIDYQKGYSLDAICERKLSNRI